MQPKSLDIVGYSSVCISRITLTEVQCPRSGTPDSVALRNSHRQGRGACACHPRLVTSGYTATVITITPPTTPATGPDTHCAKLPQNTANPSTNKVRCGLLARNDAKLREKVSKVPNQSGVFEAHSFSDRIRPRLPAQTPSHGHVHLVRGVWAFLPD
jgi:hypothetical protein